MKKVELLAPAGSLEKLKTAVDYGADAVYAGGEEFSLRAAAKNFSKADLKEGLDYCHARNKKMLITANILPRNDDIEQMIDFFKEMNELKPDGLIISDLGAVMLALEYAKDVPVHVSTQANNVNYQTVNSWYKLGAKRVVLGRELSLDEIKTIRNKTDGKVELEAFIHGAMCISYSGRCLLSNYMAARDANGGNCAHPCRWNYSVVEEKRPGEYMPVLENERGTFIFNSKDLCMIEHIPELIESGISSLKIEGRVKSEYYVACVVSAYRRAIDAYYSNPHDYVFKKEWLDELLKVSHRHYTTGFFLAKDNSTAQNYESSSYIREYDVVGIVTGYDENSGDLIITQKNKFSEGDEIEIISPDNEPFSYTVHGLRGENGCFIESAPHAEQILRLNIGKKFKKRSMLRKQKVG